ncbi:MAG: thymidylate kinase [Leptospiraceae bacterium]|nr:MAG: thymidylate kinase [Leptospiraceae bacterium]
MFFYVIEGIDGSGKSTQIKILKETVMRLKLKKCFLFLFEPTNLETGRIIRSYLKNNIYLSEKEWLNLFDKDREENVKKNILPNKDKVIIMDRYYFSTAAYQAKDKSNVEKIFLYFYQKYPEPTAIFYLDISLENALERIKKRLSDQKTELEVFEKEQELKRILENYEYLEKLSIKYNLNWLKIKAKENPFRISKLILRKVFSDIQNKNKSSL